ncbi:MAG: DUF99 family protein [Candidatus Bathyarchaeia archaeon]
MTVVTFRTIKPEIRILGIHDGAPLPKGDKRVHIVGVVMRGGLWLDGVLRTWITRDGDDATQNITAAVGASPHMGQLRVILLPNHALGGLNVIDTTLLWKKLRKPVIVFLRGKMLTKKTPRRYEESLSKVSINRQPAYIATQGITIEDAARILEICTTSGPTPEPLRVARLLSAEVNRRADSLDRQ